MRGEGRLPVVQLSVSAVCSMQNEECRMQCAQLAAGTSLLQWPGQGATAVAKFASEPREGPGPNRQLHRPSRCQCQSYQW